MKLNVLLFFVYATAVFSAVTWADAFIGNSGKSKANRGKARNGRSSASLESKTGLSSPHFRSDSPLRISSHLNLISSDGSGGSYSGSGGRGGGDRDGGRGGGTNLFASESDDSNDDDSAKLIASNNAMNAVGKLGLLKVLKSFADGYNKLLSKYTWPTKIISSTIVSLLGDLLIQLINARSASSDRSFASLFSQVDLRRMIVFSACGGLYFAPVIGAWFNWLNALPFPGKLTDLQRSLAMLFVDQTIGVFAVNGAFFFAFELINRIIPPYDAMPEFTILEAGYRSMKEKLLVTAKTNYYCWPLINFVNLRFIPLNYRLLFSNLAAVFWNMFLSSMVNKR